MIATQHYSNNIKVVIKIKRNNKILSPPNSLKNSLKSIKLSSSSTKLLRNKENKYLKIKAN